MKHRHRFMWERLRAVDFLLLGVYLASLLITFSIICSMLNGGTIAFFTGVVVAVLQPALIIMLAYRTFRRLFV